MIKRKCRHTHRQRTARQKLIQRRTYGITQGDVQPSTIKEFPRPQGCPPDSIAFDRSEYNRLNYLYGPITRDACASAFDTKVPN